METGPVTFLFTDIEGSTRLWEQYPEPMKAALARHDAILGQAIESRQGRVLKTTGDGCLASFETAAAGLSAALAAQQALRTENWEGLDHQPVQVRMALHTGEADARAGDYFGPTLNRAARLMAIGHGGQVLLSAASADLARDQLPPGAVLLDLGEHRLKDLIRPEHVFQLVHPDLPADFPPLRSLDSMPNNLPIQLTSFVGREREMAEVRQLLSSTRLLTLIGPGGTGKTRLVLQLAAEASSSFPDGVWLVELAPLSDPARIPQTIAGALGVHELPGRPLVNLLIDYLRAKCVLLVLDNCEHLIDACAQLAEQFLRACPPLKIAASSREALGIAGETIYRVPSLSLPDAGQSTLEDLRRSESVQLFVERARAVQQKFALTEHNAPAVAQICQRLDGIPLALELAAARVQFFTPQQIASRLDDRFRLLTGGSRTALPRQQTLRALVDWSYDLLSEPERALLRQLAVFTNGWTLDAAEAVGGGPEVLETLSQLVNKSLVMVDEHADADETRYHLLETIRQYARDKLFESGEAASARDRHLDYFLDLAREAEPQMLGSEMVVWINRLQPEYDNLRAAMEWGQEHRPEAALELAGKLFVFWMTRGFIVEVRRWLKETLARVEAAPPVEGEAAEHRGRDRVRTLVALASLEMQLGDHAGARAILPEAIALARSLGDTWGLAQGLDNWAMASIFLNDFEAGWDAAQELVTLTQRSGDRIGRAKAMTLMAWVETHRGNVAARQALIQEVPGLIRGVNTPYAYTALIRMGMQARVQGDLDSARLYLEECATRFDEYQNPQFEAMVRSELGHISRQTGHLGEAQEAYRKTLPMWQHLGHRAAVANQFECVAFIWRAQGRVLPAIRLLGAAEALRETTDSPMTDYEQAEYEREVAALRGQVEEGVFAEEWKQGRAMSMDEGIAYVRE